MQVTAIGSSSFIPTIMRSWTCFLITINNGNRVLVDAGSWRLMSIRKDVLPISHVFITHRHPDHITFLGALLRRMKRNGRKKPLQIFCPTNTYHRLLSYIRFFNPQGLPSFASLKAFTPAAPRCLVDLPSQRTEIWAAAACHTTSTAAYAIQQDNVKIVLAPDTGPNCPTLIALAKGATALFHDCTFPVGRSDFAYQKGHSSPEGAGATASQSAVKNLILIHISGVRARKEKDLIKSARRYFKGTIQVTRDNSVFSFREPSQS